MSIEKLKIYSDSKGRSAKSTKDLDFRGIDLSNQKLNSMYLARLDFRDAKLNKCTLTNCMLDNAILVNADLQGTTFNSCSLVSADMSAANITQSTQFKNCHGLDQTIHKQKFFASGKAMTPTERRAIELRDWKLNNTGFVRNGTKSRFLKIVEALGKITKK